jgi:hypothetical protein
MYLVRITDDGRPAIFEVDGTEVGTYDRLRQRRPKAWRFQPIHGGEGNGRPSKLCQSGVAAVAANVTDAMILIDRLEKGVQQ